jgi:hypothetical protein
MFGCKMIDVNALSARPGLPLVLVRARRAHDGYIEPVRRPREKTQHTH